MIVSVDIKHFLMLFRAYGVRYRYLQNPHLWYLFVLLTLNKLYFSTVCITNTIVLSLAPSTYWTLCISRMLSRTIFKLAPTRDYLTTKALQALQ